MIDTVARVDTSTFTEMANELASLTKVSVGQIIKARAGAMARYLAESTMPVGVVFRDPLTQKITGDAVGLRSKSADAGEISGTGLAIRALGRNALLGDLKRVYVGASAVFSSIVKAGGGGKKGNALAKAAYAALQQQRWDEHRAQMKGRGLIGSAAGLESMAWDSGQRHREKRNKRGRVPRGVKPRIVTDTAALKEYTKKMAGTDSRGGRVGLAKSAFVQASFKITGKWPRGVPAWMKQPAPASAVDNTASETLPHLTFISHLRYADEALPETQYLAALNRLDRALVNDCEQQLVHISKKIVSRNERKQANGRR